MTPVTAARTGVELSDVWALVPGPSDVDPEAHRVLPVTAPLASGYRVAEIAGSTVAAATLAASDAGMARGTVDRGCGPARAPTETDHALAAWRSYVLIDGRPPPMWADLSGRYVAGDRYVQLHCNFPHHAAGVAARLGVDEDRAAFEAAIADWDPFELEEILRTDGMICAVYRSPEEWAAHPHAAATGSFPLIGVERLGDARPSPDLGADSDSGSGETGERALAGLKVLDCSRVLAGPVCGRTLAAHGADVLRVGAPHLPSMEGAVIATGFGKRNAFIDLDTANGREAFAALLAEADVFVDAYRPGALAARGFPAERAVELRPGIVVVEICAFDWTGPWAGRRGFDSIVQTTTGIAAGQGDAVGSATPVHLPVQALDYATGYLAAFAAARLVAVQRRAGGSWRARLSLLRTRDWLVGLGGPEPFDLAVPPPAVDEYLHTVDSDFGRLTAVRPVAGRWDRAPSRLGSSPPVWS